MDCRHFLTRNGYANASQLTHLELEHAMLLLDHSNRLANGEKGLSSPRTKILLKVSQCKEANSNNLVEALKKVGATEL